METTRPGILRWTVMIGVIVGLVAVAAWWMRQRPTQTAVLPDGTVVILENVSYGKEHIYSGSEFWLRLWSQFARMMGKQVPARTSLSRTTTNTSLAFFLRFRGIPTPTSPQFDFYIVDDQERAACRSAWNDSRTVSPIESIHGVGFNSFPRRSKTLILRLRRWDANYSKQELQAEFVIPNPAPARFAEWTPEPLPQARKDGDLEFVLTRLETGIDFRNRKKRATEPYNVSAQARFQVRQSGQIVTNWQVAGIWVYDATGNVTKNTSWSNTTEDREVSILFQWGLWPDEPAWKLRAEFSRTSGFRPEETWILTNFPATKADRLSHAPLRTITNWVAQTNLFSADLRIPPLTGRSDSSRCELRIQVEPDREGWRLTLVELTDDQGRPVKVGGRSWGSGVYTYSLDDLGEVKSLNAILALHPSRFAEFLAKPEVVK